MSALKTPINEFMAVQQNFTGPLSADGALITPGASDAEGSWTDLFGGAVASNSYGIYIVFHEGAVSGQATPTLADIGIDASGGTSYTSLIPDLNASASNTWGGASSAGMEYFFPLFIPGGSRIACRGQQGNATARTFRVNVTLLQKPTHPEILRVGSWVQAIGIDQVNSRGTTITAGNDVKGSWDSIGSPTRNSWWAQASISMDNAAPENRRYVADWAIGDASNKRIFWPDAVYDQNNTERHYMGRMSDWYGFLEARTTDTFYVRMLSTGAAQAGTTAMVHVLG